MLPPGPSHLAAPADRHSFTRTCTIRPALQVVDWAQGVLLYNMRFAKEMARGRLLEAK